MHGAVRKLHKVMALLLKRNGLTLTKLTGDGSDGRVYERVKRELPGMSFRLSCSMHSWAISGRAVLFVRREVAVSTLLDKGLLEYRLSVRCLRGF